jgi:tetratricopeptide (TPR) repeat protein
VAYKHLGQFKEAMHWLRQSWSIRKNMNDPAALMEVYNSMGDVYYGLKNYEEALKFTRLYAGIADTIGNTKFIQKSYKDYAKIYAALGKWTLAYQFREKYDEYRYARLDEARAKDFERKEVQFSEGRRQREIVRQQHELKQAASWAKFVSITMLVFLGITFLVMLTVSGSISYYISMMMNQYLPEEQSGLIKGVIASSTILILGIIVIALVIQVYCLRFAMNMGSAIRFADQATFSQSWKDLRNQFRWWGIFSAITGVLSFIFWLIIMMA